MQAYLAQIERLEIKIENLEAEIAALREAYGERYDQVESLARENRVLREVARAAERLDLSPCSCSPEFVNTGTYDPACCYHNAVDHYMYMRMRDALGKCLTAGYLVEEARP